MPDAAGLKRGFKKMGTPVIPEMKGPDIDHGGKGKSTQGLAKRKKFVKKRVMKNVNIQGSKVQNG